MNRLINDIGIIIGMDAIQRLRGVSVGLDEAKFDSQETSVVSVSNQESQRRMKVNCHSKFISNKEEKKGYCKTNINLIKGIIIDSMFVVSEEEKEKMQLKTNTV